MNQIINLNNKRESEHLSACRLQSKKSRSSSKEVHLFTIKNSYMKYVLLIFIFLNIAIGAKAQVYYGEKGLGKLELLNDSVFTISFWGDIGMTGLIPSVDTGYYRKDGKILYLSSKEKKPFELIVSEKKERILENTGYPVLTKKYIKNYQTKKNELAHESCREIFDTLNHQIVYNDFYVRNDEILVIKIFGYYQYRLKWKGKEAKHFIIKFLHSKAQRTLSFEKFPLVIKGNKLLPKDKEKNEQCWIDNGFHFPVMRESKKEKEYETIARWSLGLRGLPCSICIPE